jgi:hypothetical protein
MNNCFRRFLSVTCLVALGAIGFSLVAQQTPQPAQPGSQNVTAVPTGGLGIKRVIGAAYSADQVTVTTQTLADGTKITRKRLVKEYRDGQGRVREEFFKAGVESVSQDDSPEWVRIVDPMVGVSYRLNPREHTVQKTEIPKRGIILRKQTGASETPTSVEPVPPQPTREDLGTQAIEGLEARGERITRTIPAGAEGNDQPIQVSLEIWTSTKPRLVLVNITNDPRYGESVTRLTNLSLDEPPADLFQVPADYTVRELQPVARPEPPSE